MKKFTFEELFGEPKIPCLQGPKELKSYYAITLNPLEHKRITLQIPGQKSVCKKYSNYTTEEQEKLLNYLMEPFQMVTRSDQIIFEKTQSGNLHLHTTFYLSKEDLQLIKVHIEDINKRCADKEQTYIPFDIKILNNEHDRQEWHKYIRKSFKEIII